MENKKFWDNFHLVQGWRGTLLPGSGTKIWEKIYQNNDFSQSEKFLIGLVENNDADEIARYLAMVWLISLSEYEKINHEKVLAILKKVVISNIDTNKNPTREDALIAIAIILRSERNEDPFIFNIYKENETNQFVINDALSAFTKYRSSKVIKPLALGILQGNHKEIRQDLVNSFQDNDMIEWTEKAQIYFELIENNPIVHNKVDANAILRSIFPTRYEQQNTIKRVVDFGNLIIEQARNTKGRIAGVFAKILIESVGGDQIIAGHRINEFEINHNISTDELIGLRENVGGESALFEMIKIMKPDLVKYFQNPIHELNESARKSWEKSIDSARKALVIRLTMSIVVFIFGVVLISLSSYNMLIGDKITPSTYVPFISGFGFMLLIFFSAPIKEIRQAVIDLATTSAAFIAYIHRILETSHTYTYFYLKESIRYEELQKSSEIIKTAMNDTVEVLDRQAKNTSESTINKALKSFFKLNKNVSKNKIDKDNEPKYEKV